MGPWDRSNWNWTNGCVPGLTSELSSGRTSTFPFDSLRFKAKNSSLFAGWFSTLNWMRLSGR